MPTTAVSYLSVPVEACHPSQSSPTRQTHIRLLCLMRPFLVAHQKQIYGQIVFMTLCCPLVFSYTDASITAICNSNAAL